jgi:glycosyltransferase involved in cell wall biosynthesis
MKTAVVVTTYNRPDALELVLEGYLAQSTHDFELIVADDGSADDTRQLVATYAQRAPFALKHVWHEDKGFRAAAIRNRAAAATTADYIIFSDGDCIPSFAFVAQHQKLAEHGWFLGGNRILLSQNFTRRTLERPLALHGWSSFDWYRAWLRRDINRLIPLLTLPDGGFRKWQPARWEGVKTCNLSVWRTDFERVNGLDEAYSGWGLEDSDLVIRLLHAGIKHKSARFAAPLFHLWHLENDRGGLAENRRRLEAVVASDHIAAELGLNQYR